MYLYRNKRFIQPSFWGRAFWNYMFMYSKYSDKSKRTPLQHFKTLSFFVACNKCRREFRSKLISDPPPTEKNELFKWIWKFKNEVNKRQRIHLKLNKKDITLSQAKRDQSMLDDHEILFCFFQKLILSMPSHRPLVPAKNQYDANYVLRKLYRLIQDILDNPNMSVLLTNKHHS